jgi:hypothetical protein
MRPNVMSYSRKLPGNIQQTGFTTEERRPHGRNLSTRRALTAGRLSFFEIGSPGLNGANRAHVRLAPGCSHPRVLAIASFRVLLLPGDTTTVTVPLRGVPAERRQESCQFRHMAPRGRLASGPCG